MCDKLDCEQCLFFLQLATRARELKKRETARVKFALSKTLTAIQIGS